MKVLVACEYSGVVRDAFIARSHDAISCDLLPTEAVGPHYRGDVRDIIDDGFDLVIAHPPCQYLCSSGLHWNGRVPGRAQKTEDALELVRVLLGAPAPRVCVENSIGAISTRIRRPTQIVQPWQFGHPYSKSTALWLVGLPALVPTDVLTPTRWQANGRPRWENQTPTGQNNLGPSVDRWKARATTYAGIAAAMADQWGGTLSNEGVER